MDNVTDPRLHEVLKTVNASCMKLGIDFYLLGALARDVWFKQQQIPAGGTKDVDFAVFPGIVLLKLIAFDDRPEHRHNHPIDCISIIKNYFSIESDLIYDEHNDLFGEPNRELETIAARVIGREMRKPLDQDVKLKERALGILNKHIAMGDKSDFILRMATQAYIGTEECKLYLSELVAGIADPMTGSV